MEAHAPETAGEAASFGAAPIEIPTGRSSGPPTFDNNAGVETIRNTVRLAAAALAVLTPINAFARFRVPGGVIPVSEWMAYAGGAIVIGAVCYAIGLTLYRVWKAPSHSWKATQRDDAAVDALAYKGAIERSLRSLNVPTGDAKAFAHTLRDHPHAWDMWLACCYKQGLNAETAAWTTYAGMVKAGLIPQPKMPA